MPTTVSCPSCRAALKFADGVNLAGKKVRCAKCQGVFSPKPAAKVAAKAPATTGTKVVCPGCKASLKLPSNFPAGKKIKCPKCAQAFTPGHKASPAPSVPTPAPPPRANSKLALKPNAPAVHSKAQPKPAQKLSPRRPTAIPPVSDDPEPFKKPAPPPQPAAAAAPPKPVAAKKPEEDEENEEQKARQKKLLYAAVAMFVVSGLGYYFFFSGPAGPRKVSVYSIQGAVLYKGKPAVGARVTLYPEDKVVFPAPSGRVAEDGSFKLTTYDKDDGAPLGRYKVAIAGVVGKSEISREELANLEKKLKPEELERYLQKLAQDVEKDKWADPNGSQLTAEVTGSSTKLEYDLK